MPRTVQWDMVLVVTGFYERSRRSAIVVRFKLSLASFLSEVGLISVSASDSKEIRDTESRTQ